MNAIQKFLFEEHQIRVIERFDEPWFVAADVCRALDIDNSPQAVSRLDDDEKGITTTDTLGGSQQVNIISLPGLFALTGKSRKPVARAFDRWVRHVVLVQIAKTGKFVPEAHTEAPVFSANQSTLAQQIRFLELLSGLDDRRINFGNQLLGEATPAKPAVNYELPSIPKGSREVLDLILYHEIRDGLKVSTVIHAAFYEKSRSDLRQYGIVVVEGGILISLSTRWLPQLNNTPFHRNLHSQHLWRIPGCYGGDRVHFGGLPKSKDPTIFIPREMLGIG